jgi:hypothetical protein
MTTDVLRLPGNFRIEANSTSTVSVTIDSPTTVITGDLNVLGNTTNIAGTNTNITDNILILNSGETNNYVTLGTSGLLIARGNNNDPAHAATMLYNDNTMAGGIWSIGTLTNRGVFEFTVENKTSAIRVDAIRTASSTGKLNILGNDNQMGVISVAGTHNYEDQVLDDDDIPNKKYVDAARYSGTETARKLQVGNTYAEINSMGVSITDPYYSVTDRFFVALGTSTNVVFKLEGADARVQGLTISNNSILVNANNTDLVLDPSGTGNVLIKSALRLENSLPPSTSSFQTGVYSTSTIGGGGTGIYYVNSAGIDELVSRRRAIIYGIIF